MAHQLFLTFLSNAALLLLIVYVYDLASRCWRWEHLSRFGIAVGCGIGAIGVVMMALGMSMRNGGGLVLDTRTVLMGLSGLFFGPVPTVVAGAVLSIVWIGIGGSGTLVGVLAVWVSGGLGLLWRNRNLGRGRRERPGIVGLYAFGLLLHGIVVLLLIVFVPLPRIMSLAGPMLLVYPLALALIGVLIGQRIDSERQTDALIRSESELQALYRYAPIALLKEDWSAIQMAVREIREQGHADLAAYLSERPDEARRMAGLAKVLDANEVAVAMVGATSAETLLGPLDRFFDDKGVESFMREIVAVAQGQMRYQGEASFIRLDGERRDSAVSYFVLPGHEDTLDQVVVSIIDVTGQKRYEREIRDSYALLHNLADQVPGALFQYDLPVDGKGRYSFLSKGVADIYDVTLEEVEADSDLIFQRMHPDDREWILESIAESGRALSLWAQEYRVLHRDGSVRWLSGLARPQRGVDGSTFWTGYVHDITVQKRYEEERRRSDDLVRNISENVPGMLFQSIQAPGDLPRQYTYVSAGAMDIYGARPATIQADPEIIFRQAHPDDRASVKAGVMEAARTLTTYHQEHRITRADGQELWVSIIARPTRMQDGSTLWHGYIKDVTDLKQIEVRQQLAALMFNAASEAVIVTDTAGKIIAVNPAFTRVTGYEEHEVQGRHASLLRSGRHGDDFFRDMLAVLEEEGHWTGTVWNRRKNGDVHPEWVNINVMRDASGRAQNHVTVFSDLSSLHRAQLMAERMAEEDILTGLPNLGAFTRQLERRVSELQAKQRFSCVLAFDIIRFRDVNEAHGLMFGDNVLKEVATRMRQSLGHEHVVARIGADAFAVLAGYQGETHDAAGRLGLELGGWLATRLGEYFRIDESAIALAFSTGIVVFPEPAANHAEEIIRQAEAALQRSLEQDGAIVFAQEAMGQRIRERYQFERELRDAASQEQLRLFIQPQVDAAGRQVSAEALIRWQHPQRGLLQPGAFIPLAEASDLIFDLERWVLCAVCRQLAFLEQNGHPIRIAVNISARHFEHDGFVGEIKDQLSVSGANPAGLVLEITEGIIIDNVDTVTAKMQELAALGIHFSLDDFGTGYSSLSYLKRLPIQELKIDRSFIKDAPDDPNDAALVETILGVARTMNLRVVAEGVETEAQRDFLKARDGEVVHQGYLYDKPLPLAEWQAKYFGIAA